MTEDEAKTKLCPHSGTFNASGPWPWSTVEQEEYPARCAASECMAWRTQSRSNGSNFYKDGYCGLAGSPR